jgi:hypothetical protein
MMLVASGKELPGFARKYVEFVTTGIELALLGRRALAKDAGVSSDGSGSHRIVISGDAGSFTDPDGSPGRQREPETNGIRRTQARKQPDPHPKLR